jgi:hypothetical protein
MPPPADVRPCPLPALPSQPQLSLAQRPHIVTVSRKWCCSEVMLPSFLGNKTLEGKPPPGSPPVPSHTPGSSRAPQLSPAISKGNIQGPPWFLSSPPWLLLLPGPSEDSVPQDQLGLRVAKTGTWWPLGALHSCSFSVKLCESFFDSCPCQLRQEWTLEPLGLCAFWLSNFMVIWARVVPRIWALCHLQPGIQAAGRAREADLSCVHLEAPRLPPGLHTWALGTAWGREGWGFQLSRGLCPCTTCSADNVLALLLPAQPPPATVTTKHWKCDLC